MIENYRVLRRAQKEFNSKIIKTMDRIEILQAARDLGMMKNGTIVLKNEQHSDFLFDFLIGEKYDGKSSYAEKYKENKENLSDIEKEVLQGIINSTISLYRVKSVNQLQSELVLEDLLNSGDEIKVIDINLSQSDVKSLILYARIICLESINFFSGAHMMFLPFEKGKLLSLCRNLDSKKRFIKMYKTFLNSKINISHEDV